MARGKLEDGPQKFSGQNGISSLRPEDGSKVPEDLQAKLWVVDGFG